MNSADHREHNKLYIAKFWVKIIFYFVKEILPKIVLLLVKIEV